MAVKGRSNSNRNQLRRGSGGKPKPLAPSQKPQSRLPNSARQIVGVHAVLECLNTHPKKAKLIWVREGKRPMEIEQIIKIAESNGIPVKEKSPGSLDNIAHQNQGVCLFADAPPQWDWETLNQEISRVVILDQLEDPHNLGAILRTAWLMGVDGVIASERRSVGLTPAAHKVASGGVEHVPVLFQSTFPSSIERLKADGYWVYGLAAEGAKSLYEVSFPEKVAIVTGAEDSGLRKSTQGLCDELIAIPQTAKAASYNASVATAIVLAEVFRQQNQKIKTFSP